jgi:hypothetical protein
MRGGIGYVEEFASARVLRDSYLGSIWEGTSNIVALDAISRAIGRHGAESALAADLHARLKEAGTIPQGYRDTLKHAADRAIQFAATVASSAENEGDARRATTLLYHTASAVTLAWEGAQLAERNGDARRLLLSKLVVDHHLTPSDPYAVSSGKREQEIADALFGATPVSMKQVQEYLG